MKMHVVLHVSHHAKCKIAQQDIAEEQYAFVQDVEMAENQTFLVLVLQVLVLVFDPKNSINQSNLHNNILRNSRAMKVKKMRNLTHFD